MRIRRIDLINFMSYDKATVVLPDRGIVTVTGSNGQGKSALAEAVPAAIWGKTIRGEQFWRSGEPCAVRLQAEDGLEITRKVTKGGSKTVIWSNGEIESKSQAELDTIVPTFDAWKRCSVFTSSDAAAFSTATDKERKNLLETLLGISRFDEASKYARRLLGDIHEREREARSKSQIAAAHLDVAKERLEEVLGALKRKKKLKHPLALKKSLAAAKATLKEAEEAIPPLEQEQQRTWNRKIPAESDLRERRRELRLYREGKCGKCGRGWDDVESKIEALEGEAAELEVKVEKAKAKQAEDTAAAREALRAGRDALTAARDRVRDLRAEIEDQAQRTAERALAKTAAKEAESKVEGLKLEVQDAEEELRQCEAEEAILKAVVDVLGVRGVRTHVLGEALRGIEAVSSGYLSRLDPGAELALRSYTPLKGGGVQDSISIDIQGVADGLGYRANSGGQRRSVDLALLLGLAAISDAGRGAGPGTLWCDEIFDALDDERVGRASELIIDIAKERPVVVITHNQSLIEELANEAEVRLRVEDHKIRAA